MHDIKSQASCHSFPPVTRQHWWTIRELTELKPFAQIEAFILHKSLVDVFPKLIDHPIHLYFHRQDNPHLVTFHDRFPQSCMASWIANAEDSIQNLPIDEWSAARGGFRLSNVSTSKNTSSSSIQYLEPYLINNIYNFDQFRIVKVKQVGTNYDDRTVLFVQILDGPLVLLNPDLVQSPHVVTANLLAVFVDVIQRGFGEFFVMASDRRAYLVNTS